MRHNKKGNHLGRTASHRKAMLANMAVSLIKHKRIKTTVAKAKALRTYVEPIITKSKSDTTHSRRTVFAFLKDKYAVTELFREISVKVAERPGGYTRILKTGTRLGDNAEMCIIELVDYNTTYASEQKADKTVAKRTRRGKAKSADEPKATAKKEDTAVKEVNEEPKAEAQVEEPKAEDTAKDAEEENAQEDTK
ncbi:50S ribosomal protein L17 [Perlabentimonas gracilis]|uniref:50S ribosomal protein L17 n=1 Tax=Perlabentimonas gracilis TaxID=2715279 RepID=UPI001408B787|nr:50S ribosomal protein L17 [Perlabentimonas gracilis]NHB68328.1 50S ribosomal protein L17 [Perlabentimonas gracilis]